MGRIFVMGLDGASWRVLNRFIKMGAMPFLEKLRKESAWGVLESVIPPVSAPAWVTFMTGCNPGKHGIADFYKLDEDFNFIPQGYNDIKIEPFWYHIKHHKIGIVNLPMTYPPPKVNGFLISGFMSPEAEDNYTFPESLQKEIEKFGKYETDPYFKIASKNKRFLKKVLYVIELREKIRKFLIKKYEPAIYIQIFQIPDAFSHYFYSLLDETHPHFSDKEWKEYGYLIIEIFKKIDNTIEDWVKEIKKDDVFIILSDHGFMATTHYFHIIPFLQEIGILNRQTLNPLIRKIKKIYRSPFFQKHLFTFISRKIFFQWKNKMERKIKKKEIVENKEIIIPPSSSYGIFLNEKVGEERKLKIKKEIVKALQSLTFQGKKVVRNVVLREEIYEGPFIYSLPHILLELAEGFEFSSSFTSDTIFEEIPSTWGKGNHERNGIFLFFGKRLNKKGKMERKIRLQDFAPFFLAYLGYRIPAYMDGTPPSFITYPDTPRKIEMKLPLKKTEGEYSEKEKDSILKKLKDLGYA